jgi:non-ribosomal peptide synthetase component E (peptide arylation enzyme)
VDDEGRDVKPGCGEVGEIVHRSPHLMLGYFHDDERTKAAFQGGWLGHGEWCTEESVLFAEGATEESAGKIVEEVVEAEIRASCLMAAATRAAASLIRERARPIVLS